MNKFGYEPIESVEKREEENLWFGHILRTSYTFKFKNGYGASVICLVDVDGGEIVTKGNENNPWEVAVLKFSGENYRLDYSTEITNDVVGYLNNNQVTELLIKIETLPNIEEKTNEK